MTASPTRGGYRRLGGRGAFWLYRPSVVAGTLGLALVVFGFAALALTLGSYPTGIATVWRWIAFQVADTDMAAFILGSLRLPRILLAIVTGAMLGLAGAAMQSVTRNGLADPGLIGVKEGAIVTVLGLILFAPEWSPHWRPFAGLAGGVAVALVVILLARSLSGLRFVLIGIGVSWLLSSAIALFMTMGRISEVQTAMIWLGGSLHAASWLDLTLVVPWLIAGGLLLLLTARSADATALGGMAGVGLGVGVSLTNASVLSASVIITAAGASVVGGLGFVGLIAPHVARLVFGGGQLALLVGSAFVGAALVLFSDTLGRTLFSPIQLPAGVVMAVLGVPFFLLILWKRRHEI